MLVPYTRDQYIMSIETRSLVPFEHFELLKRSCFAQSRAPEINSQHSPRLDQITVTTVEQPGWDDLTELVTFPDSLDRLFVATSQKRELFSILDLHLISAKKTSLGCPAAAAAVSGNAGAPDWTMSPWMISENLRWRLGPQGLW